MTPATTARLKTLAESRPLSHAYQGRANSFGVIRLGLALLVLLHHSMVLGFGHQITARVDLGSLAVTGFFVVSGFLITRSARTTSLPRYLWHRFLRIMPGLWICLLFTGLVVAPALFWLDHGNLEGIWRSTNGVLAYLNLNKFNGGQQFGIADVALHTPYGELLHSSVLNGSLWSLAYELLCYLGVAALAILGVLKRGRLLLLAVLVLSCATIFWNTDLGGTFWSDTATRTPALPYFGVLVAPWVLWYCTAFLIGTVGALFGDRIPVNDVLGWFSTALALVLIGIGSWSSPAMLAYAYAILWLAVRLPAPMQRIGRRHDYSYGIYIYAFVAQQVLANFGVQRAGFVIYTLASLIVTSVLAFASWHLVEKRALRLKAWSPRLRRWRQGAPSVSAPAPRRAPDDLLAASEDSAQPQPATP